MGAKSPRWLLGKTGGILKTILIPSFPFSPFAKSAKAEKGMPFDGDCPVHPLAFYKHSSPILRI
jgi:hypothetical protein